MPPDSLPRSMRGYFFALLALFANGALGAPYVPASDDTVIEHLSPDARGDALRRLAQRDRAARPEGDPTLPVTLARRYIERSRVEADPRLLGYAQGLLTPWWLRPDAPPDVLLLRATIKQARHQFDSALEDLERVLAQRPDDAQAWLTRATVLRVLGRHGDAAAACERLQALAPGFATTVCALGVSGVSGGLKAAIPAMQALEAQADTQPAAVRAWFDAELADMLERAGRRGEAERRYRAALAHSPGEPGLLAAYADLLLDDDRPAQAAALTAAFLRIDALSLRHAIALRRLNEDADAQVAALAAGFAAAQVRGEDVHLREEARFELEVRGRSDRALALAQRNWAVQHEPADARLLIQAGDAAGRPQAAQMVRDWLRTSRLEDARIPPAAEASR